MTSRWCPPSANDEEMFSAAIRRYRLGSTAKLTINRSGQRDDRYPLPLARARSWPREMPKYEDADFEFRARDLVTDDRDDPRLRDVERGVMVESVSQGGWAALAPARSRRRDPAGGRPPREQRRRPGDADEGRSSPRGAASVVFEVRRGIRTMFIELKPAWK